MRIRKFSVFILLLLNACAGNPYKQYFRYSSSFTPPDITQRRVAPPPSVPQLEHGVDPQTDAAALEADGYAIVGVSSYDGPQGSDDEALQQGVAIGADVVLTYNKFIRTVQTDIPLTIPTTQTSMSTGSATAFGSGGSATAFGSALTTTYGSETTMIPMSVDRFDFLAIYLVKLKYAFGGLFRNLNSAESHEVGTVNGVVVTIVVHGSPAAAAGFLPGDVVLRAGRQPIVDQAQFSDWLKQRQGQDVLLSIYRAGRQIELPVQLAKY